METFRTRDNTDEATHSVTVNPVAGSGEIKTVAVVPESDEDREDLPLANPLVPIRSAQLTDNPLESVRASLPEVLDELTLSSGEALTGRRTPGVVFSVEAGGVPCLVTYNLGNQSLSSIRQDSRPKMEMMDLMR